VEMFVRVADGKSEAASRIAVMFISKPDTMLKESKTRTFRIGLLLL